MKTKDILGLSVKNLLRRRARTILAIIGVVVGTCAIVVMLSIGFALSVGFQEQIESYGNLHLIQVNNYGQGMGPDGKPLVLDDRAIQEIGALPGVGGVSPILSEYLVLGIGKFVAQCDLVGVDPNVVELFGYELAEGRMLTKTDKYGVVLGNNIPYQFYNPRKQQYASWSNTEAQVDVFSDKLVITGDWNYGRKESLLQTGEEKIDYKTYEGKVVGVMASPDDDMAYRAFININDLQKIVKEKNRAERNTSSENSGYREAWIYVTSIDDVALISEEVRAMGFSTYSLNDALETMQNTAGMIQAVLGGIGAISLFVAALGITNTMIMSIYERTREIGVMKVIGANLKDISRMFLVEAGLIGFLGGCVGLVFSYLISFAMNTVLQPIISSVMDLGLGSRLSVIPLWVAAGALLFATFIGVAAGYGPARRAMKLSALESLRNE